MEEALTDARRLELARLDDLQLALWPMATNRERPDLAAVRLLLDIMEQRARLLGLHEASR
jgi:hypothetical protein